MSTSVVPPTAGPLARLRSWIRRRWRTVCLCLLLVGIMSVIAWRVPKRTSHWVRQNGGMVTCDKDRALACDVVDWFALRFGDGAWKHVNPMHRTISSARNDGEITWVNLAESPIQTDDLFNLKRLTGLKGAGLHRRQLGRGIEVFRDMPQFERIGISYANSGQLVELQRLLNLKNVSICKPVSGDIGMEALAEFPKLTHLDLQDCTVTSELLQSLPQLPKLQSLTLARCTNYDSDDLRCLQRLPDLKDIDLVCETGSLNDAALEHLSQLQHLESIALRTPWKDVTEEGMAKLSRLKSLQKIYLWKIQCSPGQIGRLQKAVPNCTLIY